MCTTNVCNMGALLNISLLLFFLPFFVWIYHTFFSVFVLLSLFYACQCFPLHRLCIIITYFFVIPLNQQIYTILSTGSVLVQTPIYSNIQIAIDCSGLKSFFYLLSLSKDFLCPSSDECVFA